MGDSADLNNTLLTRQRIRQNEETEEYVLTKKQDKTLKENNTDNNGETSSLPVQSNGRKDAHWTLQWMNTVTISTKEEKKSAKEYNNWKEK